MTARRRFLLGGVATVAGVLLPIGRRAHAQAAGGASRSKTRLILLGTGGGPRPRRSVMSTAQVILANDVPYVVDCANGVARQLVMAGVALARVRHVLWRRPPASRRSCSRTSCRPMTTDSRIRCGSTWPGPTSRARSSSART